MEWRAEGHAQVARLITDRSATYVDMEAWASHEALLWMRTRPNYYETGGHLPNVS